MGEQAQIGVKVDKNLKDEVDEILRSLGIKPTTAINGLYHYILQHRELPFIINTHVNKPSNLLSNLFMDYLLLKNTLCDFYMKIEQAEQITENNLDLLKHVVREFIANFRQIENSLYPLNGENIIDWKKAFNGAKRAFYVLETHVRFETCQGHYLEDSGIIKLSLALKMIAEAETNA
ncbi:type II toxin-antitoxin system RelB/DinJ family antitoxin [Serratia sp. P2ACOL2]|uniref:type II toxin-antitoxin system RelB/DinJ family antitoxin n=1 Tax=Serratia sp. P2ACOL2 TaxID=2482769 RepID=UPI000EFABC78|nr:type II toxin-antitoxin system RelB/DinJ family antitoxin [Serratia sp. P2ACOL2]AYO39798.1 hypothetical protein EBA31_22020 [Serratia sp. P2ACOL2]